METKTTNKATENKEPKKKVIPMVTGRVSFYGKVDDYKHTGKEFVLAIENPVFKGITEESVNKMYDLDNPNVEKAKMYDEILAGNIPTTVFFRSKFDIDSVWYNGVLTDVDMIPNFSMNNAYIQMKVNKSFIGQINLLENGTPYNPFED